MAWPPPTLPTNRTNATPQLDTHAADHNAANQAINDTVTKLKSVLKVYSYTGSVVTDAWGTWTVNVQAAVGGYVVCVGGVAMGAQMDYPAYMICNVSDIPAGGGAMGFNAKRPDGSAIASSLINVTCVIAYRDNP